MKIFYDVDTQHDFMDKDGALYVPGAELIKPELNLITNFARKIIVPVLGSVDLHFGTEEYKHREGELARWGGPFPDHCMDGTFGQMKIFETMIGPVPGSRQYSYCGGDRFLAHLLTKNQSVEDVLAENNICAALSYGMYQDGESIENKIGRFKELVRAGNKELLERVNRTIDLRKTGIDKSNIQMICDELKKGPWRGHFIEKQSYDVFTNPNTEELLKIADVKEAVVYGVATDYCVKAAVLGMQKRGIQCYVVEDAISGVTPETTKSALEEMVKAGAKFVKTSDVLEGKVI